MINYITGEKIQLQCDLILGDLKDSWSVSKNPRILKEASHKVLYLQNIESKINNPYRIFCYTQYLNKLDFLISKLLLFENKFIIYFHNSDTDFELHHLILFDKISNLEKVYTQNCNITNFKVIPIPIGLPNNMWSHGNLNIFNEIVSTYIKKTKNIYFYFSLNTNQTKRKLCKDILEKKCIKWSNQLSYKSYLKELKSHYYCVCPEGNGLDTHRLWECLYLNVIPICLKNPFIEYFKNNFRLKIITLDNWNQLDINKLKYETFDNLNILKNI